MNIVVQLSAMPPEDDDKYVIPNLRNACRVLKALGQENRGMKVADLARRLKIPSTTTLRIVHTMVTECWRH